MKAVQSDLRTVLASYTIPSAPDLSRQEPKPTHPLGVRCLACGHRCYIPDGRHGVCHVRFNRGGQLRVPGGYVSGLQVDPIEKKPFYHAFPGREALSFGMMGCDLHCSYCQNWVTSQALRDTRAVAGTQAVRPEELIELAKRRGAPLMISTYNEPLITADWAVEIFKLANAEGIVCGFVSNGNATPEVLEFLQPHVQLFKVDLKCFDQRSYRRLGGVLENVLNTIELLHAMGLWVEVVSLLVPGFNDGDDELKLMAGFLAGVGVDIPWHVTAFRPDYQMTSVPRTPAETLLKACAIGRAAGLRFVYAGNLQGRVGENEDTFCPICETRLIKRKGFVVTANYMDCGRCPTCEHSVPGVWEAIPPRWSNGCGMPTPIKLERAGLRAPAPACPA